MEATQMTLTMSPDDFPEELKKKVQEEQEETTVKNIVLTHEMALLSGGKDSLALFPHEVLAIARLIKKQQEPVVLRTADDQSIIDSLGGDLLATKKKLNELIGAELALANAQEELRDLETRNVKLASRNGNLEVMLEDSIGVIRTLGILLAKKQKREMERDDW